MSLREPDNRHIDEPVIDDSGVLVRDSERAPITLGQMAMTALLVIAILCIFFYGVTEQRNEVTGPPQQQAANSVPPANGTPSPGNPPPRATTGQGH
jgi:hypothetical protein